MKILVVLHYNALVASTLGAQTVTDGAELRWTRPGQARQWSRPLTSNLPPWLQRTITIWFAEVLEVTMKRITDSASLGLHFSKLHDLQFTSAEKSWQNLLKCTTKRSALIFHNLRKRVRLVTNNKSSSRNAYFDDFQSIKSSLKDISSVYAIEENIQQSLAEVLAVQFDPQFESRPSS